MESESVKIYELPEKLVKSLKKRYKTYKNIIKDNAPKDHWFPIVPLNRCQYIETYVKNAKRCGYDCVDLTDFSVIVDKNVCDANRYQSNNQPIKRKSSFVELSKINDENEELDFDDDQDLDENSNSNMFDAKLNSGNDYAKSLKNSSNNSSKNATKIEKNNNNRTKFQKTTHNHNNNNYNHTNSDANNNLPEMNKVPTDFKIPKRVLSATNNKSLESIIAHAKTYTLTSAFRASEAFDHLCRYLSDEQWIDEKVVKLMAGIALTLASNIELAAHIDNLKTILTKLKKAVYIDSNFWDELIFSIKSKSKKSQISYQMNSLLAGFHDYILRNKIRARIECNEAVILAFRGMS